MSSMQVPRDHVGIHVTFCGFRLRHVYAFKYLACHATCSDANVETYQRNDQSVAAS
jgi:hypothetical protein